MSISTIAGAAWIAVLIYYVVGQYRMWKERREARKPNLVATISTGYRAGVDGKLHIDHVTINPLYDDETAKCRREAEQVQEGLRIFVDRIERGTHPAWIEEDSADETPDDWERENQAAMIEAVKARGKE